ncbi:Ger(x)C family spore germination protein [Rummeliibacillus stabekisii]|uniref:Ger(x)C family spore germination protein n=1 Tax=Rummeliibacillus stabekisii TaxID=241244 RepID=UPI00203BAF18|nr:Ger(x)C family spore germination protein [Rummeliibacillus stabekisii]MCM3316165.1 Ger(x)C family spore germination protein [Rummeliibacillus stabekisii]
MHKVIFFFLIGSLFLSGCWDQRLYKDLSVISVVGIGGHLGELKAYYAYPSSGSDPTKYIVLEGEGKTAREVRIDANKKTEQTMDIAELTTILVSEETAKGDLYALLDVYYRSAQSPMTAKVVITEGSPKRFLELKETIPKEIGEYYLDFVQSFEDATIVPKTNLEAAANLMFSEGKDLALPYLKTSSDKALPQLEGLALFNGKEYTGEYLTLRESTFATLLGYRKARIVELAYLWDKKGENVSVAFDVIRFSTKKKVIQDGDNIKVQYNIDMPITMTEFPPDHLDRKQVRKPLEKFIEDSVKKDIAGMFKKIQEASSDILGIGEYIRAYHPQLWREGKWKKIYKDIKIDTNVNVEIVRSGSIR